MVIIPALLNCRMNRKSSPHPSPLPKGEGTGILAPFSLGRRVGDEGKSSPGSATPEFHSRMIVAIADAMDRLLNRGDRVAVEKLAYLQPWFLR